MVAVMTKRRRCFNTIERLAAAYLRLGLVPEPLASTGSAREICRHVEADHNILHTLGGDTRPQNCNLLPKPVHAEKTKRDIAIAAKVKRIADDFAEHRRKLLAKAEGAQIRPLQKTRKGNRPLPCGRHSDWMKPLGKWNAVRRERP
jgi:hypothetical protein